MATIATALGMQSTFWGIRDSAGYVMGTTGTIANGSASGMGQVYAVQEFSIPTAPAQRVPVLANNGVFDSYLIPAQDIADGQIVTAVHDPTFAAAVESLLIYTTDGYDWSLAGVPCPSLKSVTFIQNSPARNAQPGSVGAPGYLVRIVPNCTVIQRQEGVQNAQPHTFPYDVAAGMFDRFPWGVAPTLANYGSTRATHLRPFWSPAPLTIHTFIGDNSTTTVTLDETPYAATGAAVLVYSAGTKLAYTTNYTVNTSTKVLTFVAAPGTGVKVEIVYQFVANC